MEGSIVSLLQTIDHDVELDIVAVLNKYRKEKAENQVKYTRVLRVMNDLITFFNDRPGPHNGSFVDYVSTDVYDPEAVYDITAEDGGAAFCNPIGRRIDPDDVLDYFYEEECWEDQEREFMAEKIQAVFRGYMARRHVAWIRRMLHTVD